MLTFILVPTFAISASLVSAFPAAYAAPLPTDPRDLVVLADRGCRQPGCLFVEPSSTTSESSTPASTAALASAVATGSPKEAPDIVDPPGFIEAIARAIGVARPYASVLCGGADEEPSANRI